MEPLSALMDEENRRILLGRKEHLFRKEGFRGALFIGRVEEEDLRGWDVYVDALYPHVIFVAGARGSGKSYTLGVFVEELAEKVPYVGVVVIDPIGIYWSMKYPNRQEDEIRALSDWGLTPKGYSNVVVFIPEGAARDVPRGTYDRTFSLPPSLLTVEDWTLTFGIDRFSPQGLLLEKVLERLREENPSYTLDDIINALESFDIDAERGFKRETVRALLSRFYAAKAWGIFSSRGTPLSEIVKPGQISVIDISFLEENVGALVIGIMARRILQARKIAVRKASAAQLDVSEAGEYDIPPTWLVIDEAHTLIPSGSKKTPATDALVEYVKQGRRPGCSLLFATQQPSAIDTKILSQLDMLIVHKLVFSDDVKAVERRMPTVLPREYSGNFIKRLPVGVAVVGDRSDTTSRAFVVRIRPRRSQHEGREVAVDTERPNKEKPPTSSVAEGEEQRVKAFVVRITEDKARNLFRSYGHGFFSRILGGGNDVESLEMKFAPVWVAEYVVVSGGRMKESSVAYIDGVHGEFLHVKDGKIVFSSGLKHIYKLSRYQRRLIIFLKQNPGSTLSEIIARGKIPADIAEKELTALEKAKLVRRDGERYSLNVDVDVPVDPAHPLIPTPATLLTADVTITPSDIVSPNFDKERVKDLLQSIWPGVVVRRVDTIYRPVWVGIIRKGKTRKKVFLDAVTGVFEKELPIIGGGRGKRRTR